MHHVNALLGPGPRSQTLQVAHCDSSITSVSVYNVADMSLLWKIGSRFPQLFSPQTHSLWAQGLGSLEAPSLDLSHQQSLMKDSRNHHAPSLDLGCDPPEISRNRVIRPWVSAQAWLWLDFSQRIRPGVCAHLMTGQTHQAFYEDSDGTNSVFLPYHFAHTKSIFNYLSIYNLKKKSHSLLPPSNCSQRKKDLSCKFLKKIYMCSMHLNNTH